jgi:hypothetical protein
VYLKILICVKEFRLRGGYTFIGEVVDGRDRRSFS